jgi:hypothetical protein
LSDSNRFLITVSIGAAGHYLKAGRPSRRHRISAWVHLVCVEMTGPLADFSSFYDDSGKEIGRFKHRN